MNNNRGCTNALDARTRTDAHALACLVTGVEKDGVHEDDTEVATEKQFFDVLHKKVVCVEEHHALVLEQVPNLPRNGVLVSCGCDALNDTICD